MLSCHLWFHLVYPWDSQTSTGIARSLLYRLLQKISTPFCPFPLTKSHCGKKTLSWSDTEEPDIQKQSGIVISYIQLEDPWWQSKHPGPQRSSFIAKSHGACTAQKPFKVFILLQERNASLIFSDKVVLWHHLAHFFLQFETWIIPIINVKSPILTQGASVYQNHLGKEFELQECFAHIGKVAR